MKVLVAGEKTKKEQSKMGSTEEGGGGKPTPAGGGGGGGKGEDGKTVVVGVRMDAQSRELLTWALVKVAEPGDRVVALHVLPNSSSESLNPERNSSTSLLSLVKSFDAVLAVYEGFCNLKQVDLKLKVCRGSSLRKVLVREANDFAAASLILGVARNSRGLGHSSTSIAKYCAKNLPGGCSVLAVSNGKIVFQREATHPFIVCFQPTEHSKAKVCGGCHTPNKNSKVASSSETNSKPSLAREMGKKMKKNASPLTPARAGSKSPCTLYKEDDTLAMVPLKKVGTSPSSLSLLVKELPELRPGWPLLRRAVLHERKASMEKSRISVVQWAMRLPNRYSVSVAVHPDRKLVRLESNVTPKLDRDGRTIVPAGTDASRASDVVRDVEPVKLPKELESLREKYSPTCRFFRYQELVDATSNFSAEKLVGKGGSSRVYKGYLSDGKELAVKILKPSEDALKEFALEIEIITALSHKNIISLFGLCFEKNNLILVYDFLSRGSLEENLYGTKDEKNSLGWIERYKVAMGIAEALDYLHGSGSAQPVIHRDVKSSNILLSDDFEPQLSDFGLATWASSSSSHVAFSDVAGTFGYLAPEYFMYGKVNEKIDVYAFGVVLLELFSGRKPINTECPKGHESLVMWAKPILQSGKIKQLMDPRLGDKYDNDQMERMILAASLCIRRAPRSRPPIALVLKVLQGDEEVTEWAKLQADASEFDGLDDEAAYTATNIKSHLNLALLDVEEDSLSISSTENTVDYIMAHGSLEEYLKGRWSRSSSFD